jgi:DNA-binding NarL/FixJ family response regulator
MSGKGESCTVVVCDDQVEFRRLLTIVLGLDPRIRIVGEAGNGRQAVVLAEKLEPDLLLLDIAMPEMDGLEALPCVRAVSPTTQVVMLTGMTATSIRERALAAGASGFIEKGIDIDALCGRILEICRDGKSTS